MFLTQPCVKCRWCCGTMCYHNISTYNLKNGQHRFVCIVYKWLGPVVNFTHTYKLPPVGKKFHESQTCGEIVLMHMMTSNLLVHTVDEGGPLTVWTNSTFTPCIKKHCHNVHMWSGITCSNALRCILTYLATCFLMQGIMLID